MNYAEDRLDRRAAGSTISADLDAAHAALREAGEKLLSHAHAGAANSTLVDTSTQHEHDAFDLSSPQISRILLQLRSAHELAGRSLRDQGLCRQASYHYGLAWTCDPTDWQGAGDYAQMADLAGFPEVGILSLLYFRVGGGERLDRTVPLRLALEAALRRRHGPTTEASTGSSNEGSTTATCRTSNEAHCGCHHPLCGSSPCHVVLPTTGGNSPVLSELLADLDEIAQLDVASSSSSRDGTATATAADILEGLSRAARAEKQSRRNSGNTSISSNGNPDGSTTSSLSRYTTDTNDSFLPPGLDAMPPNLRFWEEHDPEFFPPLLQILLLKLLYASSAGGPFLRLACRAVPHLAVRMPPSSPLGQRMARDNKSHLAYSVLIRAVVLGERVKQHRRGTAGGVPYHVPVWDVVHGIDQREVVVVAKTKVEGPPASASAEVAASASSFSRRMQALLEDLAATSISTTDRSACTTTPAARPSHVLPSYLPAATFHPPLFVLGDSHCLSVAWQTIKIDTPTARRRSEPPMLRTLVPYPATGIKAWHTREQTQFFTHYNLRTSLQRLPPGCRTVLLSAGEIDCREGIGGEKLSGYYASCDDAVRNTVREYVRAAIWLATEHNLQILLLPVAPHAFRNAKKGKAAGRDQRRERTLLWNDLLREECATISGCAGNGVYMLDYERDLRSPDESSPVGFVLNRAFNADYTHLNSAFLGHLEAALGRCIEECGCRIELM